MRPYQLAGFRWLACLSKNGLGAVLADDMGLGKTLQAISVLLYMKDIKLGWGSRFLSDPDPLSVITKYSQPCNVCFFASSRSEVFWIPPPAFRRKVCWWRMARSGPSSRWCHQGFFATGSASSNVGRPACASTRTTAPNAASQMTWAELLGCRLKVFPWKRVRHPFSKGMRPRGPKCYALVGVQPEKGGRARGSLTTFHESLVRATFAPPPDLGLRCPSDDVRDRPK